VGLSALLAAALALGLATGSAAARERGLASVGLKAGLALHKFGGEDDDLLFTERAREARRGLAAGAWLEYAVSEKVSLQPELLYVGKGIRYEDTDYERTLAFDYLDIPLLVKYAVARGERARVCLLGGPVVSYLLSARNEISTPGLTDEVDWADMVAELDVGLAVGVGFDLDVGGRVLTLDLRRALGLTSWTGDDLEDALGKDGVQVRNQGWLLAAGFGL
jgi:hypothetical protein